MFNQNINKCDVENILAELNEQLNKAIQNIPVEFCKEHKKPMDKICLDSECQKQSELHCFLCAKKEHQFCNRNFCFESDELMRKADLDTCNIISLFSEIESEIKTRNWVVLNWEKLKLLIEREVNELLEIQTQFFKPGLSKFVFRDMIRESKYKTETWLCWPCWESV